VVCAVAPGKPSSLPEKMDCLGSDFDFSAGGPQEFEMPVELNSGMDLPLEETKRMIFGKDTKDRTQKKNKKCEQQ
jgi:hypothetical protein